LKPVGAGKSTVLKALSGVPGPIGDREMRKVHDLWRPVYVGADDHFVVAHASIQSVLAAAVGSSNVDQVWQALTQFLPGKSLQTDPGTLSFGQRRLLAILALIARSERAVVLDEPDKGLDERAQGLMIGLVCAFLASGGAVALASHNAGFLDRCRCAISAWRSFEVEAQEWR
jgi:ABC-type multidrug transport system ATPase subunit